MSFLLVVVGALLLLLSLAGLALGSFMAVDQRTREPGLYFALWWIPAVAASIGVFMGDPVTFIIGAFCFIVAGAAFALERRGPKRPKGKRGRPEEAREPLLYERAISLFSKKLEHWRLSEKARRWLSRGSRTRK